MTRIGGTLDRPKDLEVDRDFKQYIDAATALQPVNKELSKDNLNGYVDKTIQFTGTESNSNNPYSKPYRYTSTSNGFKIESDKYKNGEIVSTRILTITKNPNGQLDITDTTINPVTKPQVSYPDPPVDVLDYYTFTDKGGSYQVELNPDFLTALELNDDYKEWKAGQPLPNPGSMYNGLPVTDMDYIFSCLTTDVLDLSNFDVSNVNDMSGMFWECNANIINISTFNTAKALDMNCMFYGNKTLNIMFGDWETGEVEDMSFMFEDSAVKDVNISTMNTAKVVNMCNMFRNSEIEKLDLRNFDTSSVTNMHQMFYGSKASLIDVSSFDTKVVENFYMMFAYSKVGSLSIDNFEFISEPTVDGLFSGSGAVSISINLKETGELRYMGRMFMDTKVDVIDLSSFDTSILDSTTDMFKGCLATTGYARTENDVNKFNASSNKPTKLVFVVK